MPDIFLYESDASQYVIILSDPLVLRPGGSVNVSVDVHGSYLQISAGTGTATGTIAIFYLLKDIAGNANTGKVIATLGGYYGASPTVLGTTIPVPKVITSNAAADGTGSFDIFGNDKISPAGTFWAVNVYAAGNSGPSSVKKHIFTISTDLSAN